MVVAAGGQGAEAATKPIRDAPNTTAMRQLRAEQQQTAPSTSRASAFPNHVTPDHISNALTTTADAARRCPRIDFGRGIKSKRSSLSIHAVCPHTVHTDNPHFHTGLLSATPHDPGHTRG
jgi:hypothetical protein